VTDIIKNWRGVVLARTKMSERAIKTKCYSVRDPKK
jgi:hypothetical protein